SWTVEMCKWALRSRQRNVPDAPWKTERHRRLRCEDEHGHRQRPRAKRNRRNREYRWEFVSTIDYERYYAYPGDDGQMGQAGNNGAAGRYGSVFLIPGDRVPAEKLSYSNDIANSLKQPINFIKNNWLTKPGLAKYLAPGSDAPNQYRQLQTVRNQLQLNWETPQSLRELGNPTVQATIDDRGELSVKLPGHLEYSRKNQRDSTQVSIIRGINPDRLQQFKFRGFDRFRDARNFALVDEGKLLRDLRGMIIRVSVSNGTKTVKQIYRMGSSQPQPAGLAILGNIYKIRLDQSFDPLLVKGEALTYDIKVDQIARSGAVYSSGMQLKQVVDQVTLPKVTYSKAENTQR
ncbi:hypothetical protein IQ266_17450, partial [filamentous cyanobacterium LEGE 11480]